MTTTRPPHQTRALTLAEIIAAETVDPFHLAGAELYGIDNDGAELIDCHPDIYTMLADPNNAAAAKLYGAVLIVTTGWAAPITPEMTAGDMAPSQSPERRRVRLSIFADAQGCSSVILFADGHEPATEDAGATSGPLADALADFLAGRCLA